MPTVRMLTSVADVDFAAGPGEEVPVSAERAQAWSAAGWCELVRGRPVETPEARVVSVETPEGGEVRRKPGRPRKTPV